MCGADTKRVQKRNYSGRIEQVVTKRPVAFFFFICCSRQCSSRGFQSVSQSVSLTSSVVMINRWISSRHFSDQLPSPSLFLSLYLSLRSLSSKGKAERKYSADVAHTHIYISLTFELSAANSVARAISSSFSASCVRLSLGCSISPNPACNTSAHHCHQRRRRCVIRINFKVFPLFYLTSSLTPTILFLSLPPASLAQQPLWYLCTSVLTGTNPPFSDPSCRIPSDFIHSAFNRHTQIVCSSASDCPYRHQHSWIGHSRRSKMFRYVSCALFLMVFCLHHVMFD